MLKPFNIAQLRFDLIKEIGQDGKNSQAFLAQDHQLNARIVIKRVPKSKIVDAGMFFSEAQSLYASAHPNVVQIHYACEDNDYIYLAMPFYAQGSVKTAIDKVFLTTREIVSLGCQICSGLHNVHSKGLIHFDIKPDNILLANSGDALISDFGLAKPTNFKGFAEQDMHYLSMKPPEAFSTGTFDRRFDIFQLGLTLYRMCNGNQAFYTALAKYNANGTFDRNSFRFDVRAGRFPDRTAFHAHIPAKLRNVIRKCLSTDPNDRYGSALEVANALAAIGGNELDWRLQISGDVRCWTKLDGGVTYELTVRGTGTSEFYRVPDSGSRRRIKEGCKDGMSEREVSRILGSY